MGAVTPHISVPTDETSLHARWHRGVAAQMRRRSTLSRRGYRCDAARSPDLWSANRRLTVFGTNLRGVSPNGQKPAGILTGDNTLLAGLIVPCILMQPCGSILPAPHMHLLFRTPSFRGQACGFHIILPAFFFAHVPGKKRQISAQNTDQQHRLLPVSSCCPQLHPKQSKTSEGQTTCESHRFSLYWRPVRALRPAATPLANRRCLAEAPARSGPPSLAPTRFSALRSVQRATCCIARRRTTVTKTPSLGPAASQHISRNTPLRGQCPVVAFLRFQTFKTKDVPCSTRS